MANRITFRDPTTGRFISAERAAEIGGQVEQINTADGSRIVADYFDWAAQTMEPEDINEDNLWSLTTTERGWIAQPGEDSSDLFGLEPPPGAQHFRVFVDVLDNPDYPRGWASTQWLGVSAWPPSPDMVKNVDATGFNHIRFS